MNERILLPPESRNLRHWKRWKWIALTLCIVVIVFGQWLPAFPVLIVYLIGTVVEDEQHLYIAAADISGKGISAALLMANLQAALRAQLHSTPPLEEEAAGQNLSQIMQQLNRQVYLNSPAEKYATLFLGRYDAIGKRLWYCNAAHPPPILLNSEGAQKLKTTGMAAGMFSEAHYTSEFIDLPWDLC
jgi:serine phosphatase RsbU (regulator of sigma subunit)